MTITIDRTSVASGFMLPDQKPVHEHKTSTGIKRETKVKDLVDFIGQKVPPDSKDSGKNNSDLIKLTVAFLVSLFLAIGAVGTNLLEGFGEKLKGAVKFVLAFLSLFLGTVAGAGWLSRPEEKSLASEEKFIL